MLRWLFSHHHDWRDTCWNRFGFAAERRCNCGAYQHRELGIPENGPWVDGSNPRADKLRADGAPDSYPWDQASTERTA